jgi:hypothetical protein
MYENEALVGVSESTQKMKKSKNFKETQNSENGHKVYTSMLL